jgi:hypothetical protein
MDALLKEPTADPMRIEGPQTPGRRKLKVIA